MTFERKLLIDSKPTNYKIQSVVRLMKAITLLADTPYPLRLAFIADDLGLHKSTCHRYLNQMKRVGLAVQTKDGEWEFGPRIFEIAARRMATTVDASRNVVGARKCAEIRRACV
jgi:DNA-binding IclR family transcriptional regulator